MAMGGLADADLLGRLVSFDTTSSESNLACAEFICDYGGRGERLPSPDGRKANVLLRFGPPPTGDRAGLLLSGHMDVVPAGEGGWSSDPFRLTDRGDRLVARGACDMKGFLALALNVARQAGSLGAPLVLLFTYDEEVGTLGARHFVETFPDPGSLPASAIIGEPTELRVVRMHKGHLKMRVTMEGRSAHSGYPHLGRNAIEAMARVLVALRGLRHQLEQEGGPNAAAFPEVPFVPLNVGCIHGGTAVNVVPDRCVLDFGIRLLPGMERDPLVERIRAKIEAAAGPDIFRVETTGESPPMLLPAGARIHEELRRLVGQRTEASVSFATDAGWLATAGIDCAIFGPGSIEEAHKPDESVPKADLRGARGVLERAVERFCR